MTLVYQQARQSAQELLDLAWDDRLPVRLTLLNDYLGAEKLEAALGPLSGAVSKEAGRPPVILLNSNHSEQRRRFTWAHELGHIVERGTVAQDEDYSFTDHRGSKYDLHEFYADEFAGALLMPQEAISRMQSEGWTHHEMARAFDVSISALRKRLQRLQDHPA